MDGLKNLLLEFLNRAAHTALSVDPDSARAFAGLGDKVFCIELTAPEITLYLIPDPDGFSFALDSDQEPVVTLRGPASAFARLSGVAMAKDSVNRVMTDGQVSMEGDVEAGQALQKVMAGFDFDWEELIARVVGDTPAHILGNLIRSGADWSVNTANLSRENLADYLKEEKRVLPSEAAMRRFEQGVDELRADVDRIGQKLDALRKAATRD